MYSVAHDFTLMDNIEFITQNYILVDIVFLIGQ